MTIKRFICTYINKKIDYKDNTFNGDNSFQCVDLYRQYCKDVLGIPQTPALGVEGGAKDIWEKHGSLKQSKDSFAVGDILIYDATPTNKYGHVCILVSLLDTDTFVVFEQNGFEQSGAKLTVRNTTNLLGSLYL